MQKPIAKSSRKAIGHCNSLSRNFRRFALTTPISQFLGKPQKSGPIMAWTQKEVQRVENTHEFKQWLVKRPENTV
jgi:hypothetical protein